MSASRGRLGISLSYRVLLQLALVLILPCVSIRAQNTTAECLEDYDWVFLSTRRSDGECCLLRASHRCATRWDRAPVSLQRGSGILATVLKVSIAMSSLNTLFSNPRTTASIVNAIQPPNVYLGPDARSGTPCVCNTVSYATLAACAVCQGRGLAITA